MDVTCDYSLNPCIINYCNKGFNRIAQVSETQTGYFLGDALGSLRQIVDPQAEILLAQSYSPYSKGHSSFGDYETAYSYTGEMTDGTGLVKLRARYANCAPPERSGVG